MSNVPYALRGNIPVVNSRNDAMEREKQRLTGMSSIYDAVYEAGAKAVGGWWDGVKDRATNPGQAISQALMDTLPTFNYKDGKFEADNLGVGMGGVTAYRGLSKPNNPEMAKKSPITWVTPEKKYADVYGKNLYKIDDGDPVKGFDFGYRDVNTRVKKLDMLHKLHVKLMDDFGDGVISKDKAMAISEKIQNSYKNDSGKYKNFMDWRNDKDIINIAKEIGIDHWKALEGTAGDIPTKGLFTPPKGLLE